MLGFKELDFLSEDDFERSNDAHQIFMDVFYGGNIAGGGAKRSDGENEHSNGDLLIPEKAPVLQLNSSKEIVLSLKSADLFNNYPTKTCPLVESSSQGVICTTHLRTRIEEVRRRVRARDGNASEGKCRNQVTETKIITYTVAHTSIPVLPVHEKSRESSHFASNAIETAVSSKSLKDLYSRLRGHVNYLLKAAGWAVEKKQIGNKRCLDTIYKSPSGKTFPAFYKIWGLFGESLFAGNYKMIRQEDGKHWRDIEEFGSNLSETLIHFENEDCSQMEASYALVHKWSLLDPFVTVVMVKKQIGSLRKGVTVKAATTVVSDLKDRKDMQSGKEFVGVKDQVKQLTSPVSVHNKSGSTQVSGGNLHLQTEQNSVVGQKRKKQGAKALKGVKQTSRRIQAKTARGGSLANDLAQGSMALELDQSNSKDLKETQGNEKALEIFAPADTIPEFGNARNNFELSEYRDGESCRGSEASKFEMDPTSGTTGTRLTKKRRSGRRSV
ncbi:increased DNA methylation 1-like [Papaver somniferum]|uniref:increased DNA methylation 1-like n=1 Tax=Papaver somniferum TaxID=3469 RepID=UPI000E7026B7|nr:increased DNA methylation 1-like [Papaver somniferum]